MVGYVPPSQRKQYIPPNQRAAIARGVRFAWVRRLWTKRPRILLRIPGALLNLARTAIGMLALRRANDDAARNAEAAWQELQISVAGFQAITESTRRSFGDRQQLTLMRDRLVVAGDLPPTAWIHEDVCRRLQTFLAVHTELFAKMTAVATAASTAEARSRRLARRYERSAIVHDRRSAWHAGYVQLAIDCRNEVASAADIAKKVAARRAGFSNLIHEAQSIVRFFAELQRHRERSASFTHKAETYRRQLVEGVSLCLRAIDTLVP